MSDLFDGCVPAPVINGQTYTADDNDGSKVFVFGSNLAGRHGRGATFAAWQDWGAQYHCGRGRTGMAYAIPTKDGNLRVLPLESIAVDVVIFIAYAECCPKLTFLVTEVGCGLAGYSADQIAPLFKNAPKNCILPEKWKAIIKPSQ